MANYAPWQLPTGHVPKNDIEQRHKVIKFGAIHLAETEAEKALYKYEHQRADLKVSKGAIPIGFLSSMQLQEGKPIFLETRYGGYDERGKPTGPQFLVSWKQEREVIRAGQEDGWMTNLDELWTAVLAYFERKNILSEETLEYLDADPFVLFGIDDPVTQQALLKLEKCPALMCDASAPSFDEWAYYLRVDPQDDQLRWLVQAFAETELPKPWTSYKGVGSIVCYIHSDSGQVTWKHPFYDYFRQLRDFCRQASDIEIMQVRVNRLLWSYEATRVETEHDLDPLVSPEYVSRMADIFGYDIHSQGFLVRNLKAQLKIFARGYRETQNINMEDVRKCAQILGRDVEKYYEMRDHWERKVWEDVQFDLEQLSQGQLRCVNCDTVALSFCLECKDYLCLSCYDALHAKGARLQHSPFRLVSCSLCVTMPAKLQCSFTDKSLCHQCYAMKHIKMLPPDGRENQPRRIDYMQQYKRYADLASQRLQPERSRDGFYDTQDDSYDSVLSTDWHPFYDARGVKYFYNFNTGERMRQSPQTVPNQADPGAEVKLATPPIEDAAQSTEDMAEKNLFKPRGGRESMMGSMSVDEIWRSNKAATRKGDTNQLLLELGTGAASTDFERPQLTGFEALKTEPPAYVVAAMQPDLRVLRAPHRVHQAQAN